MAEAKKTADTPLRVPTKKENGQVGAEVIPVYKEKPVINIDGLTARDMLDFTTDKDVKFRLYARGVLVSLPEHWDAGDPGEVRTYLKMKLRHMKQVNSAFADALSAAKPEHIEGFAIDVWDITVEETQNLDDMAVVILVARYAKRVPAGWGDRHDVETYLDLPQAVWLTVQDIVLEAIKDLGKN